MPVEKSASKAKENRRSNKPLMEKRRRARINKSLSELKNLILDAMKKDPSRTSKLEKADILEMAVRHLQSLHKNPQSPDAKVMNKYRAGYNECTREVTRFLATAPNVDVTTRTDLLGHLANRMTSGAIETPTTAATPADSTSQSPVSTPSGANNSNVSKAAIRVPVSTVIPITLGCGNNNKQGSSHVATSATPTGSGGLQLIPTRLPNGDLALVLPNDNLSSLLNTLSVATVSAMAAKGVAQKKDGDQEQPTSSCSSSSESQPAHNSNNNTDASGAPNSTSVWRPW